MSVTQHQKLPFTSRHAVVVGINDTVVATYPRTTNQSHLAEPKGWGWFGPYTVTVHGSELQNLVIATITELVQGWNGTSRPKATPLVSDQEILADMLRRLFHGANYEVFEDGMDSDFSNSLNRIIRDYGVVAIGALEEMMYTDGVNPEVAAEALVWVGRMDDERTRRARLSLLEGALESSNICIRDAASIGIGAMDDPAAIDSLRNAISRERCGLLRQNLEDTLEQLKDAR